MLRNYKSALSVYVLLFCSILFLACNQDDDADATSVDPQSVSSFLMEDNGFIIRLLIDDGDDETADFSSYVFNFNADGSVVASDDNNMITGSYSVIRDDGRVELEMSFTTNPNFDELNDEWYFISIDQNVIRFDDDGDILEFQKL